MEGTKIRKEKNTKRISLNGKKMRPNSKRFKSKKGMKTKVQMTDAKENQKRSTLSKKKLMTKKKMEKLKKIGRKQTCVSDNGPKKGSLRLKRELQKLADTIDPEAKVNSTKQSSYSMRKRNVTWKDIKKNSQLKAKKLKKAVVCPPDPLEEYVGNDSSDLCENKVMEAVKALLLLMEDNKPKLFSDEGKDIYLQITSFKIPITSPREIRVVLPHSIWPEIPDVCLFTSDLQKGRRIDHTSTVEHFKELLREKGVTCISEIITLRQLKTEYEQYEMKRALCNSYDVFLSEAKVCGHISHLLGKTFYTRNKVPVPIKLHIKDLKERIEEAVHKSSYRVHNTGRLFVLKVANTLLTPEQIRENIMTAAVSLTENFPGGWDNVLQLMIKGAKTIPIPFYLSTMRDNLVENPVVKPLRPKAYVSRTGELPGIGEVLIDPEGHIKIIKDDEIDDIERELLEREKALAQERRMAKQEKKKAKRKNTEEDNEIEFTEEDLYRSDSEVDEEEEQPDRPTKRRRLEAENDSDNEEAGVLPEATEDRHTNYRDGAKRKSGLTALETAYLQEWQSSQSLKNSKQISKKRRK